MTFPSVRSSTTGSGEGTSYSVAMATPTAGDLIIIQISVDDGNSNTPDITTGTDLGTWTQILEGSDGDAGGVNVRGAVFVKIAAGTEGTSTETINIDIAAERASWIVLNIQDWFGTIGTGVEASATHALTGTTSQPDPPSLTASWGSDDNLFIAGFAWNGGTTTVSAWPYTDNQIDSSDSQGSGTHTGLCTFDTSAQATQDPGIFQLSGAQWGLDFTYVIRPAGAAPSGMGNILFKGLTGQGLVGGGLIN